MKRLSPIDEPWWRLRYGPDWRYLTAKRGLPWHSRVADLPLKEVARYLRLRDLGGTHVSAAGRAFPQIAKAFELQSQTSLVDDLRLMLLGKLDEAEILARTGVTAKELRLWKKLFFDVDLKHDRLSWHFNHIVGRELDADNLRLANRLHLARCGGPQVARRLLDGPGMIPSDPDEYARYVRTEAQIASGGMFLAPPQSRQEMESWVKLALQLIQGPQRKKPAENKLKKQAAQDKPGVRQAEVNAEPAAEKAAAKVKAPAEKEARDRELANWHREQQAAHESHLQAQRQSRIEQSPLQQLQWAPCEEPGTPPVAPPSAAPGSPARPVCPVHSRPTKRGPTKRRPVQRHPAQIPSTTVALGRAMAQAADARPTVPEPTSNLAP